MKCNTLVVTEVLMGVAAGWRIASCILKSDVAPTFAMTIVTMSLILIKVSSSEEAQLL